MNDFPNDTFWEILTHCDCLAIKSMLCVCNWTINKRKILNRFRAGYTILCIRKTQKMRKFIRRYFDRCEFNSEGILGINCKYVGGIITKKCNLCKECFRLAPYRIVRTELYCFNKTPCIIGYHKDCYVIPKRMKIEYLALQ